MASQLKGIQLVLSFLKHTHVTGKRRQSWD